MGEFSGKPAAGAFLEMIAGARLAGGVALLAGFALATMTAAAGGAGGGVVASLPSAGSGCKSNFMRRYFAASLLAWAVGTRERFSGTGKNLKWMNFPLWTGTAQRIGKKKNPACVLVS